MSSVVVISVAAFIGGGALVGFMYTICNILKIERYEDYDKERLEELNEMIEIEKAWNRKIGIGDENLEQLIRQRDVYSRYITKQDFIAEYKKVKKGGCK